jgi:hypothetical protein
MMIMIKETVCTCLTVALFSGGVVCAEEPAAAAAETRNPIVLVTVGDVDPALVRRCQEWAESNTALKLALHDALTVEKADFEHVTAAAAELVAPADIGVIVLFRHAEPDQSHGVHNPGKKVVLVNLRSLESDDPEVYARRVERQVIRGVAMLLGQDASPNPFSVMFPYTSLEELDLMGRNFDPPGLRDLQNAATALGLPLDPDSDYNVLR